MEALTPKRPMRLHEIEFNKDYWNGVGENKTNAYETIDKVMQKKKGFTIIHISNLEKYEDKDLSFTPDFVRRIGRYYGR